MHQYLCQPQSSCVNAHVENVFETGSIDLTGIEKEVDWDALFKLPKDYWVEDMAETRKFLETELGQDMPPAVLKEVLDQQQRVANM